MRCKRGGGESKGGNLEVGIFFCLGGVGKRGIWGGGGGLAGHVARWLCGSCVQIVFLTLKGH